MRHNRQEIAGRRRVFQPRPRDQIQSDGRAPPSGQSPDEDTFHSRTRQKGDRPCLGKRPQDDEEARRISDAQEGGSRLTIRRVSNQTAAHLWVSGRFNEQAEARNHFGPSEYIRRMTQKHTAPRARSTTLGPLNISTTESERNMTMTPIRSAWLNLNFNCRSQIIVKMFAPTPVIFSALSNGMPANVAIWAKTTTNAVALSAIAIAIRKILTSRPLGSEGAKMMLRAFMRIISPVDYYHHTARRTGVQFPFILALFEYSYFSPPRKIGILFFDDCLSV